MPVWSVATGVLVVLALLAWRRSRSAPKPMAPQAPATKPTRSEEAPPPRPQRVARLPRPVTRPRMDAISDVDDPVTAAATLIHTVAGPVGWPLVRTSVLAELAAVTNAERASDAVMFAEWAVRQGVNEHSAIDKLSETLCRYLGQAELALVVDLLDAATAAGGPEAEPYAEHAKSQLVATAS